MEKMGCATAEVKLRRRKKLLSSKTGSLKITI
jgi:hypothetical protein